MSNSIQLQLRRGTLAQVQAMTPAIGELVVASDQTPPQIFLGDGVTLGGKRLVVAPSAVVATLSTNFALVTGWQAVILNAVTLDPDGLFNTTTGVLTIKRAGLYLFSAGMAFSASVESAVGIAYNGQAATAAKWQGDYSPAAAITANEIGMRLANLNAGDTLQPAAYVSAACNLVATANGNDTEFNLIGPF